MKIIKQHNDIQLCECETDLYIIYKPNIANNRIGQALYIGTYKDCNKYMELLTA